MRKINIYLICVIALFLSQSCEDRLHDETVESAYQLPIIQPMKYKFSRNGTNSVDILQSELVQEPLAYIYSSYLKKARMMNDYDYNRVFEIYQTGGDTFPLGGKQSVAQSQVFASFQSDIINDIDQTLKSIAEISGYGKKVASDYRNREAQKGVSGYVGYNIGDPNVAFVDGKGIVQAELFNGMILGSIYLDQILNLNLDDSVINNSDLLKANDNTKLLTGKNYTQLEHHWDLAYGYYLHLRNLTRGEGLPMLKDTDQKIYDAFVTGRYEIGRYNYDVVKQQVKIIREELSKALAVRIMDGFIGNITLVNVEEKQQQGFQFISQAYGYLYAMQFARDKEGKAYFTREQIIEFMNQLSKGHGFWEKERLLADESTQGSLKNIATQIGKPFGITINQIKK